MPNEGIGLFEILNHWACRCRCLQRVGNALVITTSTLVIGFMALATSSFSLNADMGLLTAVVIAVALIAVFLLLPPLLLKIEGNQTGNQGDAVPVSA